MTSEPPADTVVRNAQEWEMEQRRGHHVSEIPQDRRDDLRESIWNELLSEYPDSLHEYEEMYVTGSWVRGEAIWGISDLDIVVVVDPSTVTGPVSGTQKHFKNEWSPGRNNDAPWLFVDLWLEVGPPKERVVL